MNSQSVVNHIVQWLIDYKEKSMKHGFIVGISGGIDSAVTSTLAAKTGEMTLCLEILINQSSTQNCLRARKHINSLESDFSNVSSIRIDLTDVFNMFADTLPKVDNSSNQLLTLANSRARLRMMTLYYFSGLHHYLVTGTSNKVEDYGIGFYTKYGDGGVDVNPIGDLMKSEVYLIGKSLGVCEEIMTAHPTDGLWDDNRTDESQLGASYSEFEWAMNFSKKNSQHEKLSSRQKQVLNIYENLHRKNKHKIMMRPVCHVPDSLKYLR